MNINYKCLLDYAGLKVVPVFIARDITDRKRAEELKNQNIYLQEEIHSEHNFGEIFGDSKAMLTVFKHIDLVAATDSTVFLTGEKGSGKKLTRVKLLKIDHFILTTTVCGLPSFIYSLFVIICFINSIYINNIIVEFLIRRLYSLFGVGFAIAIL